MAEEQILAEKIEQKRSKWLLLNLLGFVLWDGIRILQGYLLTDFRIILTPLELVGGLLWMVSLVQLLRLGKDIKANPLLQAIFNDELVLLHRMQAWKTGFIVVLGTQIAFLLVHLFYPFSAALAAELSIFLGVSASITAFIYFQR